MINKQECSVGDEKGEDDIAPHKTEQFDKCKVIIKRIENKKIAPDEEQQPPDEINYGDIQIYLQEKDQEEESKEQSVSMPCKLVIDKDTISMSLPYPLKKDSHLVITSNIDEGQSPKINQKYQILDSKNLLEVLSIDLNTVNFTKDPSFTIEQSVISDKQSSLFTIKFELQKNQQLVRQKTNEPGDKYYRFDFSATNLPLKQKKFSFFKSSPLISFYEILSLNPESQGLVLYESNISKIESCDPFWTLTSPLPLSLLQPLFQVNIYQSIDVDKTKRALVASLTISMDSILGDEKETMFDVPDTKGKTIFMLDRIQQVNSDGSALSQ